MRVLACTLMPLLSVQAQASCVVLLHGLARSASSMEKLEGMSDFITLPVTHPLMMKNKDVIRQVVYYLRNGTFNRNTGTSAL
jgi:hypothetical protein